jgi:hypothetical protein
MKDGKYFWEICEVCGGTARASSPVETYQVRLRDVDGELIAGIPTPPAGYIQMDSSILDFNRTEVDQQIEKAFMMMQIDVSNTHVKGQETALGKQIDRDELFSFLQTLANELFEAFQWTANTIGKMREGSWKDVTIMPPHDFQVRGQDDLVEEISNSSIPAPVRRDALREFNAMRFASDPVHLRINEVIEYADKLYMVAPEDIRVHSQNIKDRDIILHLYIAKYITEFIDADSGWLDKPLKVLEAELLARAEEDVKERQPFSPIFDE